MNLLGAVSYDPAGQVSKATSSLLAMTAFDTTNLRVAVTIPASGLIYWRMMGSITGATTLPAILVGIMNGATVVGRAAPQYFTGTQNAATHNTAFIAEGYASGLTPGALNLDAAYAVQVVVANTNIKYGGANTNAGANASGALTIEIWDPQPITPAKQLLVDGNGRVDVIKIAGTTQTARDIGASVLLSAGTGTGQLDFTSGVVKSNVTQLLGTAWLAPGTAGTPDVNVKLWNALSTVALPLAPTVAGRTLDVSATGEAGLDWANIGSPTTAVALSGTSVASTGAITGVTFPANFGTFAISLAGGVTVGTNGDKTGYALTAAYDPAKTAAQAGDVMKVSSGTGANQVDLSSGKVALQADQPVNIAKVNGVTVNGAGTSVSPWGP